MFFGCLVTCACLSLAYAISYPGIYVDNGLDQTVIDREISKQEKQEMELEILELLGLPRRPKTISDPPLKKSTSRFLMEVYNALLEEENERNKRSVESLSGDEIQAIDDSDVIMTFESKNHRVSSLRHNKSKKLWFDVSEITDPENILGGELRIYKNATDDAEYTITIYQIRETKIEYLASLNATGGFSGWLHFNLTGCLATWVAFPNSNMGLYLTAHPPDKPDNELKPDEIGLVNSKRSEENQPFLVAFLKATNHVKTRQKRNINRRVKKANYMSLMRNSANRDYYEVDDRRSCRIKTLYISFRDLKWQDWIIAPEGYAAYYCSGECNFPLNGNMNATNHAIVQTLVHLMKPLKYPKPCCAPTKLTPISVLYFLDDTNVVLKKYKKMVVKSCGCH